MRATPAASVAAGAVSQDDQRSGTGADVAPSASTAPGLHFRAGGTRGSRAHGAGHPGSSGQAEATFIDDPRDALSERSARPTRHASVDIRGAEGGHRHDATGFPGRRIHLQRGYRQSAALDLAPLAAAVREGDAATALSLLRTGDLAGVQFHEGQADPLSAQRDGLLAHWTALAETTDPAEALARAGRLRILTAVRDGPQGARGLNARIEALLGGSMRRGAGPGYFHGRLLLITENSYRHRLFNGDIGICLADDGGAITAWFPGDDPQRPRPFHPAALPAHDSAFAMTVHKAQGSEFDEAWLVLPERDNRVLSRELVYTGLTRARSALHVAASDAILRAALGRHAGRWSGLAWRLGAMPAPPPAPGEVPVEAEPPAQGALF
ncbi:ATP-binding domain-containing protein [Luteimonas sp. SJ-16]|uniref:ATP-binding domain-containing protein n=2 Tax=Luteimonas deserti TaxID=2752306 RepID=A0A7Z0TTM8_9GAMM|nr:ATP-binding domain-containing protein [Luteimonas deserti]